MSGEAAMLRINWAGWWIQRNPMYLLSAACMALGARLYLVSPSTRAGDGGVILLTLGILQAYEWAVTAVLLALNRRGRSPEDRPSLLLVAALFWTGPMAATAEMTVHNWTLGLICAVAACVIAFAELAAVHRLLGWRFSLTGRAAAAACVLLLAVAPPLLRVPESVNGRNEVGLYAAWWLLAGIGLAGLASVRHHLSRGGERGVRELGCELAMLGLTAGAAAAHLAGMNYAYFGHAQWFYASPLLVVVSMVMMDALGRTRREPTTWMQAALRWVAALLPVIAVVLAHGRFDEHLPLKLLPGFLRDPLLGVLVLAGLGWWFGFRRLGDVKLLHAGSVAMGWAAMRGLRVFATAPATLDVPAAGPDAVRNLVVIGLYLLAIYLLCIAAIRRCRGEAMAAVMVHQVAWTLMWWDRTPADVLIVCISAGWCWLACLHLLGRPSLMVNAVPLMFLALVAWGYDFAPELCWYARAHAAAMMLVLVVVALLRPASRYALLTGVTGLANGLFYSGRWIGDRENAVAAFVVIAAFLLLAAGATISWRKHALLEVEH